MVYDDVVTREALMELRDKLAKKLEKGTITKLEREKLMEYNNKLAELEKKMLEIEIR